MDRYTKKYETTSSSLHCTLNWPKKRKPQSITHQSAIAEDSRYAGQRTLAMPRRCPWPTRETRGEHPSSSWKLRHGHWRWLRFCAPRRPQQAGRPAETPWRRWTPWPSPVWQTLGSDGRSCECLVQFEGGRRAAKRGRNGPHKQQEKGSEKWLREWEWERIGLPWPWEMGRVPPW